MLCRRTRVLVEGVTPSSETEIADGDVNINMAGPKEDRALPKPRALVRSAPERAARPPRNGFARASAIALATCAVLRRLTTPSGTRLCTTSSTSRSSPLACSCGRSSSTPLIVISFAPRTVKQPADERQQALWRCRDPAESRRGFGEAEPRPTLLQSSIVW
jgi:hypothetical protein